jgi:hypothetical protein
VLCWASCGDEALHINRPVEHPPISRLQDYSAIIWNEIPTEELDCDRSVINALPRILESTQVPSQGVHPPHAQR